MSARDKVAAAVVGAAVGGVVAAGLAFCGRLSLWLAVPLGVGLGGRVAASAWSRLPAPSGDDMPAVAPFDGPLRDLPSVPDRDRRAGRWSR